MKKEIYTYLFFAICFQIHTMEDQRIIPKNYGEVHKTNYQVPSLAALCIETLAKEISENPQNIESIIETFQHYKKDPEAKYTMPENLEIALTQKVLKINNLSFSWEQTVPLIAYDQNEAAKRRIESLKEDNIPFLPYINPIHSTESYTIELLTPNGSTTITGVNRHALSSKYNLLAISDDHKKPDQLKILAISPSPLQITKNETIKPEDPKDTFENSYNYMKYYIFHPTKNLFAILWENGTTDVYKFNHNNEFLKIKTIYTCNPIEKSICFHPYLKQLFVTKQYDGNCPIGSCVKMYNIGKSIYKSRLLEHEQPKPLDYYKNILLNNEKIESIKTDYKEYEVPLFHPNGKLFAITAEQELMGRTDKAEVMSLERPQAIYFYIFDGKSLITAPEIKEFDGKIASFRFLPKQYMCFCLVRKNTLETDTHILFFNDEEKNNKIKGERIIKNPEYSRKIIFPFENELFASARPNTAQDMFHALPELEENLSLSEIRALLALFNNAETLANTHLNTLKNMCVERNIDYNGLMQNANLNKDMGEE